MRPSRKIMSLAAAAAFSARERKKGRIVVTTNGCFDLLHAGHVASLERAKSLGDVLIVGVNSDASVRSNKDPGRPLVAEKDRARVIAALECVDAVFIFGDKTPVPWIPKLRPHVHAKGADRSMREIVEKEAVEAVGGRIVRIPLLRGKSTSALIRKIADLYG